MRPPTSDPTAPEALPAGGRVHVLGAGPVGLVLTALLQPVATPANLMVMGPGVYRFGDYWRLGLPPLVLFVVATLLVPVFWSF